MACVGLSLIEKQEVRLSLCVFGYGRVRHRDMIYGTGTKQAAQLKIEGLLDVVPVLAGQ